MKSVDTGIKRQLIEAVSPDYLAAKKDRLLGYTKVTSLDLLNHLVKTYGGYNRDDRKKNEELIMKSWDSSTEAFEIYLTKVNNCRAYAEAAGDAISDKRTVDLIISNFEKTADYPDYVKDWNKKPEA